MSDDLHIGAAFFESLYAYAEHVSQEALVAAHEAMTDVVADYKREAAASVAWAPLASNIESWSQDGRLVVGVQNPEHTNEAQAAELGDQDNPPAPLFRNSAPIARRASQAFDARLRARLPEAGI